MAMAGGTLQPVWLQVLQRGLAVIAHGTKQLHRGLLSTPSLLDQPGHQMSVVHGQDAFGQHHQLPAGALGETIEGSMDHRIFFSSRLAWQLVGMIIHGD